MMMKDEAEVMMENLLFGPCKGTYDQAFNCVLYHLFLTGYQLSCFHYYHFHNYYCSLHPHYVIMKNFDLCLSWFLLFLSFINSLNSDLKSHFLSSFDEQLQLATFLNVKSPQDVPFLNSKSSLQYFMDHFVLTYFSLI